MPKSTITGPCAWVKPYNATRTGYQHVIEVDLIADYVARVEGEINGIQPTAQDGRLGLLDILNLFSHAPANMAVGLALGLIIMNTVQPGHRIPVEVKTGRTPDAPYDSHMFLLVCYSCFIDRATGLRPRF